MRHAVRIVSMNVKTILLLSILSAYLPILAQGNHTGQQRSIENITIDLNVNDVSLSEVLRQITKSTKIRFSYRNADLEDVPPVSIKVEREKLQRVLNQLTSIHGLEWKLLNDVIVIRKLEAKEARMPLNHEDTTFQVQGIVRDEHNNPIPGVSVSLKGTGKGVTTNDQGQFYFTNVPKQATLLFSSIGFLSQERKIGNEANLSIIMHMDIKEIEAVSVVSTGYQDIPKERATGSFEQVDNKLLNRSVSTNVLDRLRGVVPGLNFENRSRAGGGIIMIRGNSTINANAQPLVVVDGFPYDESSNGFNIISNINPNDVLSVTVLKDAAAASIWGARSGNGVIVITTKRGRYNQKMRMQLNSNVNFIDKPDVYYLKSMSSTDAVDFETAMFNSGVYNVYDDTYAALNYFPVLPQVAEILLARRRGAISQAQADEMLTNLQKNDVREDVDHYLLQSGINQQYSLSFSGGLQNFNYYGSVGYDNNRSNAVRSNNDRLTIRYENTYRPIPKLEVNAFLVYTQSNNLNNGLDYRGFLLKPLYTKLADSKGNALAIPYPNGLRTVFIDTLNSSGYLNWQYKPLDELNLNDQHTALTDNRIGANVRYTFFKGLIGEVKYQYQKGIANTSNLMNLNSFAVRDMINRYRQRNADGTYSYPVPVGNILDKNQSLQVSKNIRGQLNYSYSENLHDLATIAGIEAREVRTDLSSLRSYGYDPGNGIASTNLDFTTLYPINPDGFSTTTINNINQFGYVINRYISYFGNMSYTFKKKYTVSLSGRIDGSNFFGLKANQRKTPLWSVGGMWNIANEAFYHIGWLSSLQLRATYGFNGNTYNSVTAYPTITNLPASSSNVTSYATIITPGNPQIRWEKIELFNIGVDFGINGGRLSGSMEYYRKKGIDLIGSILSDPTTGFSNYTGNRASIKGNGMDLSLNSINLKGALLWSTHFIFSYNTDKVTQYENIQKIASQHLSDQPLVGRPLYSIFSYKWAGLDPTNGDPRIYISDTISAFANGFAKAKPEDLRYMGSSIPRLFGSIRNNLSFKNFELSFNVLYKFDYYLRRKSISYTSLSTSQLGHPDYARRWTKPGDEVITNVPSAILSSNIQRDYVYQYSDILVIKGDHIRLQDIRVSYDISRSNVKKLPFENVQLYLYATNLGIIWRANKDQIDPDYGDAIIPPSRSLAVGFNIGF